MTESASTAVAISPSAVLTMAPGANLSAYVQTVGAIPMLSQERELELAEKLFYDNCVYTLSLHDALPIWKSVV